MIMKQLFFLFLLGGAATLVCTGESGSPFKQTVPLGKTIEIRFDENGSTGYIWRCTCKNAQLIKIEEKSEYPTRIPGAPGKKIFSITGLKSGAAVCTFEKRGPVGQLAEQRVYAIKIVV